MYQKIKISGIKHILLICLLPFVLRAAFEPRYMGAWSQSIGGAGNAGVMMTFAAYNNPALLGLKTEQALTLSYRSFYGLSALNRTGVSYNRPGRWAWGADFTRMGNATYNENTLSLALARASYENLSLGVSVDIYHLYIKGYGQATSAGLKAAVWYQPLENVNMSFLVGNINEPKIGKAREILPVYGKGALAWQPMETVQVFVDALFTLPTGWDVTWGMAFAFNSALSLRLGSRPAVGALYGGLSVAWGSFRLDYALEVHPELNMSHALDVRYAF
ncbi:MAG: hypothetical protein D6677_06715 [Calditrichaeota bacterium]|nr:MAG: hypothetical protein D6677_06715 [Calditrichota bacterium]